MHISPKERYCKAMSEASCPLSAIIDGHLVAYNNHNIKEFAKFFAQEVIVNRPPVPKTTLKLSDFLLIYQNFFSLYPNAKAKILNREVHQDVHTVIDTEEVNFGDTERGIKTFKVTYIIKDRLIASVEIQPDE